MIMNGLIPVFSAQWITWVTGYALGENDELVNLALSLAFMSGYTIIVYLSYDRIKRKYKESMMIEIEQEMMDAVVLQPQQSFHRYDSSFYTSFFLNDLKMLEDSYFSQVPTLISGIVQIIFTSVYVVVSVNGWILLYFILSSFILLWIPKYMSQKIQEKAQFATKQAGELTAFLKETFQGFDTLAGNNVQELYTEHSLDHFLHYELAKQKVNWLTMISSSLSNGCGLFFQFVLLFILAICVTEGKIKAEYLISITSISGTFMNGVFTITEAFSNLQTSRPIIKKVQEFQNNPRISSEKKRSSVKYIVLKNVDYSINNKVLIDNCSYVFEKGKKYLIIGKSGSGKSTLFNLLNGRISCNKGKIEFRKLNHDSCSFPLYEEITTISQKPVSFQGTVKTNIQMNRFLDDKKIKKLLEKVNLPLSVLDQPITEDNTSVSGGELQRISIARALADPRSFLLCDEITANIDPNSASIVEHAVTSVKETGILYIAHHYTKETIKRFDVILELKNGKLIDVTSQFNN